MEEISTILRGKYEGIKSIGKGAFGEVFECKRLNSNETENVAIKIINY